MANFGTEDPRGPGMKGGSPNQYGTTILEEVQICTADNPFGWDWDCIPPLVGRPMRFGDQLQYEDLGPNATNIFLNYRILRPDGVLVHAQEAIGGLGIRSSRYLYFNVGEGMLLSVVVMPNGNTPEGTWLHVNVGIVRNHAGISQQFEQLLSGYITEARPLTWPGPSYIAGTDGAGVLRSITGSTPAAGNDINEQVPINARWIMLSMRAQLATAVAVANRQVALQITDGSHVFYRTDEGPVQAASLTWNYTFAPIGYAPVVNLNQVVIHYDQGQRMNDGFRIQTGTSQLQAADQWTAPQYTVLEWLDGI